MIDIGKSALRVFKTILVVVGFSLPIENVFAVAANCTAADLNNVITNPSVPDIIAYNTSGTDNTYCELCGTGQVRIVVTNPTNKDMTDFVVRHVFDSDELEYVLGTTNGGADGDPNIATNTPIAGATTLTWTQAEIGALARIDGVGGNNYNTVEIIFNIKSRANFEEDLVLGPTDRDIQAFTNFNFCELPQTVTPGSVSTNKIPLPINEPEPSILKQGRNIDAAQGGYTPTVYGNINDDVIWRITITNNGDADLQDLRFDDLMSSTGLGDNFDINYVCDDEADAVLLAVANGVGPGNCYAASPSIPVSDDMDNFIVEDPFGNMGTTPDGYEIDVIARGGSTEIYFVGKILNSCDSDSTNLVDDVQWGCEADNSTTAGGILQPSTGAPAITSTARVESLVQNPNTNLDIQSNLSGLNGSQPVGSRGLMTITITNNTGGSVRDIEFTSKLPPQYAVDQSFIPRINVTPLYGTYRGMADTLEPLVPTANPEDFKEPVFILTSNGDANPNYPDQINMLRHGDVAVIQYRVVMVQPDHFDNKADIDVPEEQDLVVGDNDPDNRHNTNPGDLLTTETINIKYKDFCDLIEKNLPDITETHDSWPEDLDIDLPGAFGSAFILTNDPNQLLRLEVEVRNRGGHNADDYHVYVTFGSTMFPTFVPNPNWNCTVTSNPPPLEVWDDPEDIPATATVYDCNRGTISPGARERFYFDVRKVQDTDPNGVNRLNDDDLTFRADVIGEIRLSDNTLTGSNALLTFPTVSTTANGGQIDNQANNYSLDSYRAKVIGFNLTKDQLGYCSEDIPAIPPAPVVPASDEFVEIGEECTFHIETGGWFGFQTPGFTYIAVENVQVTDQIPNGQGYISSIDVTTDTDQIKGVSLHPPPVAPNEGFFDWTFNQVDRITAKDKWFKANATTRILNEDLNARSGPNFHAETSSNVLVSTFTAIFHDGVGEVQVPLDDNAIGYPNPPIRTVDLTIAEPNILVTKEVCNETLYGTGTGCTEFHQSINDGDTQDSYIYRITLENNDDVGNPTGVTRAPAYNVTVTDILDASDLMFVRSFATDDLDNDGDGLTDEADEAGEGTILTDNLVYNPPINPNQIPAEIEFSHSHSSALLKIEHGPANRVFLYYRVDPDDAIAPLQELENSVSATYDSLEGASGNQSAPLGASGTVAGAREYTSATALAEVIILPLQNQPKTITRLSNTTPAVPTQGVSVGEEIEYQLRTFIPVANLREFKITDVLPAGISCVEAPKVDLDDLPYSAAGFEPGGEITPTCNNNLVEWDFGDQELTLAANNNRFDFSVRFIARIENIAGVGSIPDPLNTISNGGIPATNVSYRDEANNLITQQFSQVDVRVDEPDILLNKTYEAGNHDAGNVITVTVTAENTGSTAAYNLRVFDDLDAIDNLTFLNNVGGTDPPDNVTYYLGNTNRPIFSWDTGNADYAIAPGEIKTFTFDISVDLGVQPHEILDNTIQAAWQSLPEQSTALNSTGLIGADGSTTGMRNGTIPINPADTINDYETTASASSTVPAVTVTKTDLNPASTPGDLAEVGVHKNYEIVINLPEGTTDNLRVDDNLDFSVISYVLTRDANYDITYTFNGIATINDGLAPSEANLISAAPINGATGTLTWDFGKVVTETEDDTPGGTSDISPSIIINYHARVDNSTTTNTGDRLQNEAEARYTHGETTTPVVLQRTTSELTVTESEILAANVTKFATAITPGNITAGHIIEYVITIPNSGNATAYDLNIVDTLPANFSLDTSFTPTAIINGVNVVGFNPVPSGSPNGPLIWGRGNADNSLDIPPVVGNPLILTYRAIVGAGAESNVNYINSVVIDWTSLNNTVANSSSYERTGAGCPTITAPNDYCVGPITSTILTADTNSFAKAITYDSYAPNNDATARIGDTVTYRLSLGLQEGTTRNVNVQDVLPAGLEFLNIISINGDTNADYNPPASGAGSNFSYSTVTAASLPAAGATGTINFTLGDVVNDPAGDATTDILVIEYQARVLNNTLSETPTTQTLTNTATLQFIDGNGAPVVDNARLQRTANLTVVQPQLVVTKTEAAALVNIGTPISYTINVLNSGDSPAYNLTVTDVLDTFDPAAGGMCDNTPTINSVEIYDNSPALIATLTENTDYTVNYSGCTLTVTLQSTVDAVLATGNNLIITYDAQLDADTPHASVLTNIAGATQWLSQDAASATSEIQTYTKALTDGTVGTLDHEDAATVTTRTPTVTIVKDVENVTTGQNPGLNATPGDILRYTIDITNTSGFELYNFSFTDELDDLNADARFVANTLNLTAVPAGADITNTDAAGGAKGTGLVDVRNLNLGIGAVPGDDRVTIEFEVQLVPSIPDATIVLNQGHMVTNGVDFPTDDPNDATASDPTETAISSAPVFVVEKISTDLTGEPNILLSGDTLRYTITVKNTGTEDTVNTIIRDQLPANTTYVAGSTTLNGNAVTEPVSGTLPLQAGIDINTPVNTTAGEMIADGTGTDLTVGAYATITFDVTINNNVVNGTIISNQAYVSADGIGSGAMADTPSDDPGTPTIPNDPTRDVVGNQPLLDAHKTVTLYADINSNGFVDPGDTLRYSITISNTGATPATGVRFVDAVPANTSYVPDSVTLNTLPVGQPDAGVSPLIAGIPVSSSDLTPPLPTSGNGTITVGQTAVITFDVQVNPAVPSRTVISNQGNVYSNELPVEPTDADGIDSNGDQPTLIIVGNEQLLTITKSVSVVGGGPVLAGGQLEYRVLVTNISTIDATNVVITDNLNLPVAGQLTYDMGSGLLNGLPAGVSYANPVITADYDTPYNNLPPGQTAELVFRVDVNNTLPIGTTITNTGTVTWNASTQTDSATISVDVGGTPGVANVNGQLWHDKDFDNIYDSDEVALSNWSVDIYRDTTLLGTITTDASGNYSINGLVPNYIGTDRYDLRFRAPGSNATTAKLGMAYSDPALTYINALHRIYDIVLNSGANVQNLNLPIDPNGVVYNSVTREAIPGATISLLNSATGNEISSDCFDDINQQNQVTTGNGYYKFDLNFSQADCNPNSDYLIRITPPAADYSLLPSVAIPPQNDATTAAFDVPNCPATADDVVAAPAGFCEVQVSELAPTLAVAPASPGTNYYLHLTLDSFDIPGDSQIFNNHLPIDPILTGAVAITKTTPMVNVSRSKLVPYTITFTNNYTLDLTGANIIDNFPAGFKYVEGSARYDGVPEEPVRNGLQLAWNNKNLVTGETHTIKLLLIVGAGVSEGEYINTAHVIDTLTNSRASGVASATVRVVPDPDLDCSHVIGKVFDDKNLNGYQDENEKGLAGTKLVTVRGLVSTTDKYGRFHLTCAVVPNEDRGTNFILKLDERSLPTGYRVTTENPRVQRVTRGKMAKFNFGSALHRVVSMDIADGVFAPGSTEMNSQWKPRIDLLIKQLKDKPSILRLSYLADVDNEELVEDRLDKVKQDIIDKWLADEKYKLTVETEIFWRRGGPPEQGGLD